MAEKKMVENVINSRIFNLRMGAFCFVCVTLLKGALPCAKCNCGCVLKFSLELCFKNER